MIVAVRRLALHQSYRSRCLIQRKQRIAQQKSGYGIHDRHPRHLTKKQIEDRNTKDKADLLAFIDNKFREDEPRLKELYQQAHNASQLGDIVAKERYEYSIASIHLQLEKCSYFARITANTPASLKTTDITEADINELRDVQKACLAFPGWHVRVFVHTVFASWRIVSMRRRRVALQEAVEEVLHDAQCVGHRYITACLRIVELRARQRRES